MDRRVFVKSGALALVTMGLSPTFLRRAAFGATLRDGAAGLGAPRGKTLICLFQRGAADALNVVVPHGERAYYALRPSIAIARPGAARSSGGAAAGAIDLDGFFGLHPALAPLEPLYRRGLLAPIHAVGSPSATRSHFDAQDYMETGTPDQKGTPDGWLNRYLATRGTCEACRVGDGRDHAPPARSPAARAATPFRAVALSLRCTGLHGVRHSWRQGRRRLAQPLASGDRRAAVSAPCGCHGPRGAIVIARRQRSDRHR